jgi:hypothetical protein
MTAHGLDDAGTQSYGGRNDVDGRAARERPRPDTEGGTPFDA